MPEDDVALTPEATAVVHRIERIDAALADVGRRTEATVGSGLKGGFIARALQQDEADLADEHTDLMVRRAHLVERLKTLTGVE